MTKNCSLDTFFTDVACADRRSDLQINSKVNAGQNCTRAVTVDGHKEAKPKALKALNL